MDKTKKLSLVVCLFLVAVVASGARAADQYGPADASEEGTVGGSRTHSFDARQLDVAITSKKDCKSHKHHDEDKHKHKHKKKHCHGHHGDKGYGGTPGSQGRPNPWTVSSSVVPVLTAATRVILVGVAASWFLGFQF